jgi:putative transposase
MKFDPNLHHRRSIRLKGHDYSQAGMYFVTLCAKGRQAVLGEVIENEVVLSEIGKVVVECWLEIPSHFPNVELDQFVVMPNHVHGIVIIKESLVGTRHAVSPLGESQANHSGKGFIYETQSREGLMNQTPTRRETDHQSSTTKDSSSGWPLMKGPGVTLGKVIRAFKAKCSKLIHDAGHPNFSWQRNFYEHIIRDERDLDRIRRYILDNPINWEHDDNFPRNIHSVR